MIATTSIKTSRVILTCKNPACKHTRAIDYGKGELKNIDRQRCPLCQSSGIENGKGVLYPMKAAYVKGTLDTTHICDARCLNAKGQDCICECGGENHGKSFLI
jgi:hypothetical protein